MPERISRDAIASEIAKHETTAALTVTRCFQVRCKCGNWTGGIYREGWSDPAAVAEWNGHRADAILACLEALDA